MHENTYVCVCVCVCVCVEEKRQDLRRMPSLALAILIASYFPRRIEYGDFLITSMNCACVCGCVLVCVCEGESNCVKKDTHTASVCVGGSTQVRVCVCPQVSR